MVRKVVKKMDTQYLTWKNLQRKKNHRRQVPESNRRVQEPQLRG